MPAYFYWGEDDYRLSQAVTALRQAVVDPDWESFNYEKLAGDNPEQIVQAFNQSMTPPFGPGSRLIWLAETTVAQRCSEELLGELERTLASLPETSHLLLTSRGKPDGRIKSTKVLQKYATVQEFSPIPPWKTDELVRQVQQMAKVAQVRLTTEAAELLAEAVGNDSRRVAMELEKLSLYASQGQPVINGAVVLQMVTASAHNSLQLADAIREGQTARALGLVSELLLQNEAPLRISATLTGQFRTWLWVKLMLEAGERDEKKIAEAAEVGNPKQIYFLRKKVEKLSSQVLTQALPMLLKLETGLKRGAEETAALQTAVVELSQLCASS
ncbi:DNA polymerase III subunit delta [Leptolyngbya sp. FACHB-261]|uniref:DNA polymerase III subunit delta n=1 Tax=Leptolyngbya sp. FACHB-261 TaxID=2692806 RepID=UPI0016897C6B|nr:DNA polymerase III subunit delta [Leptolyngbya sp. FACHB-261]MBD2104802.1 DNA polymerase III subunit delta [Leptolyngbya sp. FACHB-261]